MKLGVCYYPEQWPEAWWRDDAMRMAEIGIKRVRIGEFAWSRLEPEQGRFEWGWLDRAIEVLVAQGLEIVLGTPTATPPKWLIDLYPDVLAHDRNGRVRRFGSRRHYDFSSEVYKRESARITLALAERYGSHPGIVAWQTDNEYGCHDTVESYSPAATAAFRRWLEDKYSTIGALNSAWGSVFWSMEFGSFGEVDLPNLTVTEANPAHRLDFQRFSSDQVVAFNRVQTDILRAHSPGQDILHNFMGFFTAFDHYAVGADLDVATWDSYPLGFLEQGWWDGETKNRYLRQGHPDIAGFHHDLYRGMCVGRRWQVMEQQPGPVNWAPYNPSPLPGMVRLWTWEAFAHGAEVVSYFRWRQAPFAQEQMHAGLLRPDSSLDWAAHEAMQVSAETRRLGELAHERDDVALVFDYSAKWVLDIQRQGADFDYFRLCFEWYGVLRRLGLNVDIVPPHADLSEYRLIVCPSLPIVGASFVEELKRSEGVVVFGPRCGSKTSDYRIPDGLPPGDLQALMGAKVLRVESLRPGFEEPVLDGGAVIRWIEHLSLDGAEVLAATVSGLPVWIRKGRCRSLAAWGDEALVFRLMEEAAAAAALKTVHLPRDLRLRSSKDMIFAFNYGPDSVDLAEVFEGVSGFDFQLGGSVLKPAEIAAWWCAASVDLDLDSSHKGDRNE
jgi:beta-galactosidase